MGKWEDAVKDYEVLLKETPENEEAKNGVSEARKHLGKDGTEGEGEANAIVPS